MIVVVDIFDWDGDGYIDYYEFVVVFYFNKDVYWLIIDVDKIEDEVIR